MKSKNLILMVVAVGCGLVAAFLTSQMSAGTKVEKVDVIVAATDIPVGVNLSKEDLTKYATTKTVSKDAIPPDIVEDKEELVGKRLMRPIRAGETISRKDLNKGGIQIPKGKNLLTIGIDTARAAAGLAQPGSRVDVLAFVNLNNKLTAMPILVNMLVVAVNGQTHIDPNQQSQGINTVSFAADRKQGLVLELAKGRGCQMSLLLRHPDDVNTENERNYNIDEVIALLQDDKNPAAVALAGDSKTTDGGPGGVVKQPGREGGVGKDDKGGTVRVPYALVDIKGGTELTPDLIGDDTVFGVRDLPKDVAGDAVTDLTKVVGKTLRSGLGKGQWVTPGLVGDAGPKPSPRDADTDSRAGDAPAAPARPTRDVTIHTSTGSKTLRYEEWAPGRWRLVGEVRRPSREVEPEAAPATPAPQTGRRTD